jgi:hypothetical protein
MLQPQDELSFEVLSSEMVLPYKVTITSEVVYDWNNLAGLARPTEPLIRLSAKVVSELIMMYRAISYFSMKILNEHQHLFLN